MSSPLNLWRRAEQLKLADTTKSSNEVWLNRQSLQEIYQNLLIADLEFSLDKKVEQDLWNFAFKKQITTLQNQCKDKQNQKKGEVQAGLNLFLDAASGFYVQLLQDISNIFSLDLPFRRKSMQHGLVKEYQDTPQKNKVPSKSSCLYLCQDCLVHLGDIARYRQNIEQAQVFYKNAAQLVPMNGQPYNQLAILEVQRGNKLSTIFYHTRSLAVQHPFPVAEINCSKFFARISKDGQETRQKVVTNEWLSMFLQFLASIHLELDPMKSRIRLDRILLSFKPTLSSPGFNSQQLLQVVSILFFEYHSIVDKMLKNSGKGHFYRKSIGKESHVLTLRREDGDKNFGAMDDDDDEEEDDDEFAENDGKVGRRGRVLSGVQLNQKELEEVYKKRINLVLELAGTMMESISMAANEKEGELRELLLPIIKVMLDWLVSNDDVANHSTILKSGLWTMLCPLANSLIAELNKLGSDPNFLDSLKSMPLPEDRELQCFLPLRKAHSQLSFTWRNSELLSADDERRLRIQRIFNNCIQLEEIWEATDGGSSGLLTAKYTSDDHKKLLSFETRVCKTKPEHFLEMATSNPTLVEGRPARLNVAMQTILQKSMSDVRTNERSEGDGESASKTKRSLKVEFKETVEDIWKDRESDASQGMFTGEERADQQAVDRNNNNSPHPMQNFHVRPFNYVSPPCLPPYFSAPLRAPMYPFYPLPPPPQPFAFRPGCPLPAPSSMMPRFCPMSSVAITVTMSDSSLSSEASSKGKPVNSANFQLTTESEFPCLPSKKIDFVSPKKKEGSPQPLTSPPCLAMPKGQGKQEVNRECGDEALKNFQQSSFQFPNFQPIHPFPRPMHNPQQGAGMPYMSPLPLPSLHSPYVSQMMPGLYSPYSGSGIQQAPCRPYMPQEYQEGITGQQSFKTSRADAITIPPHSSSGLGDNQFRGFNQNNPRVDAKVANIFGSQLNSHHHQHQSLHQQNYDMMRLPKPPGVGGLNPGGGYQFLPNQSNVGFCPPSSEFIQQSQDLNSYRAEINKGNEGVLYGMPTHQSFNESNCRVPPTALPHPPIGWAAGAKMLDVNAGEKLQGFDVRLCGQRAMGKIPGPSMNFSNCNNSQPDVRNAENASFSYNLFSQSPWTPFANNSVSNANPMTKMSNQRDQMAHAAPSLVKHEVEASGGPWKDGPATGGNLGHISIMKSTNNVVTSGNVLQSMTVNSPWLGHQTPLEKLLQQQKQLKPNGS